jgi:spermidine synthase
MSSSHNNNYAFNEMIVHIPLCSHKQPKHVLIVGNTIDENIKKEVLKHSLENIEYGNNEIITKRNKKDIDVVIVTDNNIDSQLLANINRIIKNDGILCFISSTYDQNSTKLQDDLKLVGDKFWITMPFRFESNTCILASKKYHPVSDIILQVSDLLPNLNYYSSAIHTSSFIFPVNIHKALNGIAKR